MFYRSSPLSCGRFSSARPWRKISAPAFAAFSIAPGASSLTSAPGRLGSRPRDLHERPEISALVSCIRRSARSVIQFLKIGSEDFEITGCWANVNAPGASHAVHSHPNNFLSGVYYVQVQPGGDTINFHDPRIQTGIIRPPVTELTQENTDQVVVSVSDGMLLVFPSYLQHSVASNQSDAERISVSFNIMFSAYTENLSRPLW